MRRDNITRKRVNKWYIFWPCLLDVIDPCHGTTTGLLKPGQKVKTINKVGCPRFGTMGQCYIESEKREFLGMVSIHSLKEIEK